MLLSCSAGAVLRPVCEPHRASRTEVEYSAGGLRSRIPASPECPEVVVRFMLAVVVGAKQCHVLLVAELPSYRFRHPAKLGSRGGPDYKHRSSRRPGGLRPFGQLRPRGLHGSNEEWVWDRPGALCGQAHWPQPSSPLIEPGWRRAGWSGAEVPSTQVLPHIQAGGTRQRWPRCGRTVRQRQDNKGACAPFRPGTPLHTRCS